MHMYVYTAPSVSENSLSHTSIAHAATHVCIAGALALGTEPPTASLLDRRPYSSNASLISLRMWRHVLVQAAFQLALLLTLLSVSEAAFGINVDFLNET